MTMSGEKLEFRLWDQRKDSQGKHILLVRVRRDRADVTIRNLLVSSSGPQPRPWSCLFVGQSPPAIRAEFPLRHATARVVSIEVDFQQRLRIVDGDGGLVHEKHIRGHAAAGFATVRAVAEVPVGFGEEVSLSQGQFDVAAETLAGDGVGEEGWVEGVGVACVLGCWFRHV